MRLGATEVDTPSRAGWNREGSQFATGSPSAIDNYKWIGYTPSMDTKLYERHAKKLLDVFSDGRLTGHDLIYLAFYTVINAHPLDPVLDRLIEYTEHVKAERERYERNKIHGQDTLF